MSGRVLSREFYERDPAEVARELLGKILVRRLDDVSLKGVIVETEAYYGQDDPASRAYKGRKKFNELMFKDVGKTFIYMVHGNWLLNIVAHPKDEVGAVLIRALEPLEGVEIMMKNRGIRNIYSLTNGPGKLTKALAITKDLNGIDVTERISKIQIIENIDYGFEIQDSYRINVKKDLPIKLRFFIKGNKFVSRLENPRL
ncbi:MAG: DNA-3-methyladenine glycosylase [Thaumarchaeota archaeon]|jgi:DNA-3-methyladenine glycosylase|nr:DNA-3-methyladenine glycosylase [Candidatus Geocrenenecus arthurdayi]